MSIPENLRYTREHEWILADGDTALVGITDYAQKELGDIVYIDIQTEGQALGQGEAFGTIEAVKTVSDVFMPAAGEILEVNPSLEEDPSLVNSDPYGEGWLVKVALSDASQIDGLLDAAAYAELIG